MKPDHPSVLCPALDCPSKVQHRDDTGGHSPPGRPWTGSAMALPAGSNVEPAKDVGESRLTRSPGDEQHEKRY